jgi:hypothetical protein
MDRYYHWSAWPIVLIDRISIIHQYIYMCIYTYTFTYRYRYRGIGIGIGIGGIGKVSFRWNRYRQRYRYGYMYTYMYMYTLCYFFWALTDGSMAIGLTRSLLSIIDTINHNKTDLIAMDQYYLWSSWPTISINNGIDPSPILPSHGKMNLLQEYFISLLRSTLVTPHSTICWANKHLAFFIRNHSRGSCCFSCCSRGALVSLVISDIAIVS